MYNGRRDCSYGIGARESYTHLSSHKALRHVGGDARRSRGAVRDRVREVFAEQRVGRAHGQGVHGQEVRPSIPRGRRRELWLRNHLRVQQHLLHVLRRKPSHLHLEMLVKITLILISFTK